MPYDDYLVQLAPTALQGDAGQAWFSALGIVLDGFEQAAIDAVECRYLQTCPEDALAALGVERMMPQLPGESAAGYRARLLNAWTTWLYLGTKLGILTALTQIGFGSAIIKENWDWSATPSPGFKAGDEWWRFWVIIPLPNIFSAQWTWGSSTTWGSSRMWSVGQPAATIASIRKAILQWKPSHAILENIIIVLSGFLWGDGTQTWGGGAKWGSTAAYV